MKSQKLVIEELSRMKSLFGYERGRVISEQVVPGTPNYGFTATTTTPAVPIPQALPTAGGTVAAPATTTTKVRKPDPKVMELQKQLKAAGYNLGKSGPNKDGVDGVMGPRTRAAQQQMTQQKGQDALKTMTKQGQDFQNNLNKRVQQLSALTPEQQANANALKAGQPLPQAKAPAPTTTQTVQPGTVVTQQPPTEPGQTGEFKDGWYWDEKQQQWYQP